MLFALCRPPPRFGFSFVFFFPSLFFVYDKHFICKFLVVIKRFHRSKFVRKLNFNTDVIHVPNRHACVCVCCACYCFCLCHFCHFLLCHLPSCHYCLCETCEIVIKIRVWLREYQLNRIFTSAAIATVTLPPTTMYNIPRAPFSHHTKTIRFAWKEQKKGEKIPRHFNIKTQNFDAMHNQLISRPNRQPISGVVIEDNRAKNMKKNSGKFI